MSPSDRRLTGSPDATSVTVRSGKLLANGSLEVAVVVGSAVVVAGWAEVVEDEGAASVDSTGAAVEEELAPSVCASVTVLAAHADARNASATRPLGNIGLREVDIASNGDTAG